MTEHDMKKLSPFHTKSLRKILRIFWPRVISNKDLLVQCHQESMRTIIRRRRWSWVGHVLRMEGKAIPKTAVHWTPEGKRQRRRPRTTWRRTIESELKTLNYTWGDIEKKARDRHVWRSFVAALSANGV